MATSAKQRLAYLDWMRGLACVLMFQTHCFDAWLSPAARDTDFFRWSQLIGSLPAPLFLFLAGISFALVTDRMRRRGAAPGEVARFTILRGAEIFGIALLFRIQQWSFGLPWSPWTDLLRVDVLNCIGLSMMLMGVLCRLAVSRAAGVLAACGTAALLAVLTPLLWTTWRPRLFWPLESYINGVHIYAEPQPWLFPLFPWAAFAFAGLATGLLLFTDSAQARTARAMLLFGTGGIAFYYAAKWLDALPVSYYPVYDYWHTSPNYFLARVGILLLILVVSYAWCRWGLGTRGFSPLVTMGQTSLLVYWVHIEFVYGRFSILPGRANSIERAALGLLVIFAAMTLLSAVRLRWKGRGGELAARIRGALLPARAPRC